MYRVKGKQASFTLCMSNPWKKGWKPNIEISPTCPRCRSSNTKFCYYNNYRLTQPRYFCKGCRRYWTKGGSLRNVPIGGGCRMTRRTTKHSFRDVLPMAIPPRGVSSGGRVATTVMDATTLGLSGMNTQTLSPPSNDCSTLTTADHQVGPNLVDLAMVYANFLNQKLMPSDQAENYLSHPQLHHHHSHPQIEIPMLLPMFSQFPTPFSKECGTGFVDHQCRPLSFQSPETNFSSNGFHFSELESIGKQTYYNQIISSKTMENHQTSINYSLLPPLPGEELSNNPVVSEGLVWSAGSNNDLIFSSQIMQPNQLSISAGIEEQPLPSHSSTATTVAAEEPKQQNR